MNSGVEQTGGSVYFVPEGYSTDQAKLMGRHAAGEGFIRAWMESEALPTCCVEKPQHAQAFLQLAKSVRPDLSVRWHSPRSGRLPEGCGSLYIPGPDLGSMAQRRAASGSTHYSLCGVTHTISSLGAQDSLMALATAPVEPWDAVVCTSTVVKIAVERLLDEHQAYLAERLGASRAVRPMLPVIPLGVDCQRYRPDAAARQDWRGQLGIGADDLVFLYVGRLSFHAKAHPLQMFEALQATAARLPKVRCHLVLAGWFANKAIEDAFHTGARDFCPQVTLHVVDARQENCRFGIWSAADIFLSLSDNYQETFGLTPLEAMACGLPVVVSDWNGYRDTIPDGEVGYRIPTYTAPPGGASDLALQHLCGEINYDHYSGHSCQFVAIDLVACVERLVALGSSASLRRQLGEAGRARAVRDYDWRKVVADYRALWVEQAARRQAAKPSRPRLWFPDPTRLFAEYPTHALQPASRLALNRQCRHDLAFFRKHDLLAYGMSSLLPEADMARLRQALAEGGTVAVTDLAETCQLPYSALLFRTLLWFVKTGQAIVV